MTVEELVVHLSKIASNHSIYIKGIIVNQEAYNTLKKEKGCLLRLDSNDNILIAGPANWVRVSKETNL